MSAERTNKQAMLDQPMRERNISAIVSYYLNGIKPEESMGSVGIELEHVVVHDDLTPVPYSGNAGVASVLDALRPEYPQVTRDAEGDIMGVSRSGEGVTIEPAAQIELSAGPFISLVQARSTYDEFETTLDRMLQDIGAQALATGYHPSAKALDLELIPKQRYKFMNEYLSKTDTCGPCMMRGSAATQVSVDYTSEQDCLRKMRLAFALSPILSLICDNSPIFEGKPRTHKLVRTYIWNHMDSDRSGLVPGALSKSFTLQDYAAYILDKPAILVKDKTSGEWVSDNRTFGEIYAHNPMTHEDVAHALSMFFTDVRLKTYIEIRPADAMPVPYAIAYAALIKGLFYHEANLDSLSALFGEISPNDYDSAKIELMARGYDAVVYGRPVSEWCDIVMEIATNGLNDDEKIALQPLSDLVSCRVTLADITEHDGFMKALISDEEVRTLTDRAHELKKDAMA